VACECGTLSWGNHHCANGLEIIMSSFVFVSAIYCYSNWNDAFRFRRERCLITRCGEEWSLKVENCKELSPLHHIPPFKKKVSLSSISFLLVFFCGKNSFYQFKLHLWLKNCFDTRWSLDDDTSALNALSILFMGTLLFSFFFVTHFSFFFSHVF